MADTVQYLLEEQIPELEDYEAKGYFTKAELRQIIQRRQDFEYRLKRRAALKHDYYRYIEYESKLDELRKYRKKQTGIKGNKSIADTAITKKIHFIYERAARKFKSDMQLWLDWLSYCRKSKSHKQHSKVVTRALQRHATSPVLWIEAARWEFEQSGDPAAARTLMQQGLRMCKHEEVMWVEYMRMELLYIHRLRARRQILGLDVPETTQEGAPSDVDPTAAVTSITGSGAEGSELETAVKAVLTGAVAGIVLKQAIAAIPESLQLRRSLLGVLADFDFPGTKGLVDHLYDSIARDFGSDAEAWDLLARRPIGVAVQTAHDSDVSGKQNLPQSKPLDNATHSEVIATYNRAVMAVQSERMFDLYSSYLESRLESCLKLAADELRAGSDVPSTSAPSPNPTERLSRKRGRPSKGDASSSQQSQQQASQTQTAASGAAVEAGAELLAVYRAAHDARCASSGLYLRWVRWAEQLGQPKMAGAAVRQACKRHPDSIALWTCRLRLDAASRPVKSPGASGTSQLLETLKAAVKTVKSGEGNEGLVSQLWLQALDAVLPCGDQDSLDRLVEFLELSVIKNPGSDIGQVVAAYLKRIRHDQGLEAAWNFIKRFSKLTFPGEDFFLAAIDIELEASRNVTGSEAGTISSGGTVNVDIKKLFEAAVSCYGRHSPELWVRYAQYEVSCDGGGGGIYWRATKALEDPEPFVALYQERIRGLV